MSEVPPKKLRKVTRKPRATSPARADGRDWLIGGGEMVARTQYPLDFSRIEVGRHETSHEPVDFAGFIEHVVDLGGRWSMAT